MHIKIITLVFSVLFALSTQANSETWEVDVVDDNIRFYKNGNTVHGHHFGFIKRKGECDTNYLYISWSSYENMKQFEGEMIPMIISNEKGESGKMRPPLEYVGKFGVGYIGYFDGSVSRLIATDGFINFIEQSKEVTITITQREHFKEGFDIFKETFDISKSDFIKAKKDALKKCLYESDVK